MLQPQKNLKDQKRKISFPVRKGILLLLSPIFFISLTSCNLLENQVASSDPSHLSEQWKAHSLWWESIEDGDFALFVRKLDKAIEYFKLALKRASEFGEKDPRLAKSYISLGRAYIEKGDFLQARDLLSKGLTLKENYLGKNSNDLSNTLNNISLAEIRLHRVNEAKVLSDRALKLKNENKDASGIFEFKYVKALILLQTKGASVKEIEDNFDSAIKGYSEIFKNKKMLLDTVSLKRYSECLEDYTNWLKSHNQPQKLLSTETEKVNVEKFLNIFEGNS